MWLTDEEIVGLTRRQRYPAQVKALRAMGVDHKVRGDGSPAVLRTADGPPRSQDEPTPEGMLPRQTIVTRAKAIKKIAGVYFLVAGSSVIYVGQSLHVVERIGSHLRRRDLTFDSYYYLIVPKCRLLETERAYIRLLKPRGNVVGMR